MILAALYKCRACGLNFKIHYPELGEDFKMLIKEMAKTL